MSINVNVTGNPICIKRGKMVTADPDFATKDFQKRRLIRLQQVRQQSKDIAANVRDKVRRAKDKQLSDIEKLGEKELMKWQARKLLELQQQHLNCLKDIGLGHSQAIIESEQEDAELEQQESYDQIRKERGKEAMQRVREDFNKKEEEQMECSNRRHFNQAVENCRSSMVVNVTKNRNKSPFKKQKKKKYNKSLVLQDVAWDTDSEVEVPLNTAESRELQMSPVILSCINNMESDAFKVSDNEVETNVLPTQELDSTRKKNVVYPIESRISDRIKRRRYRRPNFDLITNESRYYNSGLTTNIQKMSQPKLVDKEAQTSYRETQMPSNGSPVSYRVPPVIDAFDSPKRGDVGDSHVSSELPFKPKLTMRTVEGCVGEGGSKLLSGRKVQHYDHKNRFSKEYELPVSSVQRVKEDSIEVCPSVGSEAEFVDTIYKRDREALLRGQKALEKVKAQQDYKEMMRQLPRLQKQERLASISLNKPEFHMSENRLKENEKKRQNRLENAYEKLFPQNNVITIAPKQPSKGTISNLLSEPKISTTNVITSKWDIDKPTPTPFLPSGTVESTLLSKSNDTFQSGSKISNRRKESLLKMLKNLNEHRDKFVNELKSMPETSSLHTILGDLSTIDEVIESGRNLDKDFDQEEKSEDPKDAVVPPKVSTPKPVKKVDPRLSKKPKSKANTNSNAKEKTARPRVYRYRCKYVGETKEESNSKTKSPKSPKQSADSSTSLERSPLNKCKCGRARDEPPAEKCDCKENYRLKTAKNKTKADVAVEAATLTADKALSVPNISQAEENDKNSKECVCATTVKPFSEACEIVIKICDDGKHRISVSPKKEDAEERRKFDSNLNKAKIKSSQKSKCNATWEERFSQNSNHSTSTSYYSPPEIALPPKKSSNKHKSTTKNILRDKPQQRNLNDGSVVFAQRNCVKLDDRTVLMHMKKLLNMSRASVEELMVSTVSDVSTPDSSVVNIESNRRDPEFEHPKRIFQSNDKPCGTNGYCDSSTFRRNNIRNQTVDEYCTENYPDILQSYNEMAEGCAKKIDNLAAMIENVRLQRMKMFESTPTSDKDNSTRYFDLPSDVSSKNRTHTSPEQQKLNEELLRVKPSKSTKQPENSSNCACLNNTDEELLERFYKLKEVKEVKETEPQINKISTTQPVWLDIPRLPIFGVPFKPNDANNSARKKSKPPPSKGITVARCYNRDITSYPHELSAIPEVDSFVSSKVQQSPKSDKSDKSERSRSVNEPNLSTARKSKPNVETVEDSSSSVPDILNEIDSPIRTLNAQGRKWKSVGTDDKVVSILSQKNLVSDSSTNEMDGIEVTLKQLGMGWAVSTIKKTQEALALKSTSSSSIEISSTNNNNTNGAFTSQISSESLTTSKDSSTSALSIFLQGLADTTHNPDSGSSANKTSRKTSTPVQVSGNLESQNLEQPHILLTAESDLSSIQHHSNDYIQFYSLNEITANQTKDDTNQ